MQALLSPPDPLLCAGRRPLLFPAEGGGQRQACRRCHRHQPSSPSSPVKVPSLEQINSNLLHQWEQSLAVKPSVLTTDLTLVPIYELVPDEEQDRRLTLRDALDDLLRGELRVHRYQGQRIFSLKPSCTASCYRTGAAPLSSPTPLALTEQLEEIAAKVQLDLAEKRGGGGSTWESKSSVKTRRDAVEGNKPASMCSIL